VKQLVTLICLGFVAGHASLQAAAEADTDATLRQASSFALGGVGVAGTMSEGERALRQVLKEADAGARLERLLPDASAPGQLYLLLGLRARDRSAYQRALARYGQRDTKVQTMRGCILQEESFRSLVKEIDRGEYDSSLARSWPKPGN
jgi:hypothetical protein